MGNYQNHIYSPSLSAHTRNLAGYLKSSFSCIIPWRLNVKALICFTLLIWFSSPINLSILNCPYYKRPTYVHRYYRLILAFLQILYIDRRNLSSEICLQHIHLRWVFNIFTFRVDPWEKAQHHTTVSLQMCSRMLILIGWFTLINNEFWWSNTPFSIALGHNFYLKEMWRIRCKEISICHAAAADMSDICYFSSIIK